MQQVFSNFTCLVFVVLVDTTTSSDVSKCANCYSSWRQICHQMFLFIWRLFLEDHSLHLRKFKINKNLQFIFKFFISIYQLYSFYQLPIFVLHFLTEWSSYSCWRSVSFVLSCKNGNIVAFPLPWVPRCFSTFSFSYWFCRICCQCI